MPEAAPVDFSDLRSRYPILPDTPLIRAAFDRARTHSAPYLFNHVARSWLFAEQIGQMRGRPYDREVVAVATLLHDMGLTDAAPGPNRFEVNGANAAADFVRTLGLDDRRAQLVWDGIALHATASISFHKEIEVALCARGISVDFGGPDFSALAPQMGDIVQALPRLDMKRQFRACCIQMAQTRPETTYDNFIRDFGLRFVAGYTPPSSVDRIMGAPFPE
ncbi:MAG: hypothetical protein WA840_15400 [Caulobacteraceae bacterium]